jgi:hypothetical protein
MWYSSSNNYNNVKGIASFVGDCNCNVIGVEYCCDDHGVQQGQLQQQTQGCSFTGTATGIFTCSQGQQQGRGGQ